MQQYDIGVRATEYAINSQGSAMKENAEYMNSLEARIQKMKTAWETLSITVGDSVISDSIVVLTKILTVLSNSVEWSVSKFGTLPTVIGAISVALLVASSKFRGFSANLGIAGAQLLGFTAKTNTAKIGLKGLTASAKAANLSIKGLFASTVVGAAFVALGIVIESIINKFGRVKEAQDEYFHSLRQNIQDSKGDINTLIELREKLNDPKLSNEDHIGTYKELSTIIPEIISHFTDEGEIVYKNRDAIKSLVEEKERLYAINLKNLSFSMTEELNLVAKEIEESRKAIEKLAQSANARIQAMEIIKQSLIDGVDFSVPEERNKVYKQIRDQVYGGNSKNTYKDFLEVLHDDGLKTLYDVANNFEQAESVIAKSLANIDGTIDLERGKIRENIVKLTDDFKSLGEISLTNLKLDPSNIDIDEKNLRIVFHKLAEVFVDGAEITEENRDTIKKNYEETLKEVGEFVISNRINLAKMFDSGDFDKLIKQFPQKSDILKKAFESVAVTVKEKIPIFDEYNNVIGEATDMADAAAQGFKNLEEKLGEDDAFEGYIAQTSEIADNLEQLSKEIDSTVSELSELNTTIEKVSTGQSLNGQEIHKLIRAYPSLRDGIIKTADGYSIEQEALELVRIAKLDYLEASILAENDITQSVYDNLKTRLDYYGVEIDKITDVASARQQIAKYDDETWRKEGTPEYFAVMAGGEMPEQFWKDREMMMELGEIRENFNKVYKDPRFGAPTPKTPKSTSSKSTKEKEDKPSFMSKTDATINKINNSANRRNLENLEIEKVIERENDFAKKLEASQKLIVGNSIEINRLHTANEELNNKKKSLEKNYEGSMPSMDKWLDSNGEVTEAYIEGYNNLKTGTAQKEVEKQMNEYKAYFKAIEKNEQNVLAAESNLKKAFDANLQYIQEISDSAVSKSNRKISLLGNINTEEEKKKLAEYNQEISNALRKESKEIASEIGRLNKIINDPKYTDSMRDAARQSLKAYQVAANETNLELIQASERLGSSQAEAVVFGFNKSIEDLKYDLSLLSDSDEDVKKAEKINSKIKDIIIEAQQELNKQILELERKLSTDLNAEDRMRAQTKLEFLQESNREYQLELVNLLKKEADDRKSAVDKIISDYKKMLEKKRDFELAIIDDAIKKENDRHKNVMDNYKKELDEFRKIINAQLKSMDRDNATEDYDRELNKLLKEEAEIQSKINTIAHNDSFVDKAKRKELEEKLAEIQEEIETKQRERGRNQSKEALEDLLSDREDHIGNLEDMEAKQHDNNKKALDAERERKKNHWESVLNDEKKYYDLKQNLLSSDLSIVQNTLSTLRGEYDTFFTYLKEQSNILSSLFGDMLGTIDSNTKLDYEYLNDFNTTPSNTGVSNSSSQSSQKAKDWQKYLANKKEAEAMGANKGTKFNELRNENNKLRDKYGFPDLSYDELKDIQVYHKGGEVGVEKTTSQKWWSKLLKSDEIPAVLRKGEVVLDEPVPFIRQLVNKTINGLSSAIPRVSSSTNSTSGTFIENIHLVVNESAINNGYNFADEFVEGLNRRGIRTGRRN